jgi:hypothetical protein
MRVYGWALLLALASLSVSNGLFPDSADGLTAPARISPERHAAALLEIDGDLLTAVCWWETRRERRLGTHDTVLGDGGKAVGRCQVHVGTAARWLGITREQLEDPAVTDTIVAMLRRPVLNTYFAGLELRHCLQRRSTIERAVYCYQRGRMARWAGPTRGTKNVLAALARIRSGEKPRRAGNRWPPTQHHFGNSAPAAAF